MVSFQRPSPKANNNYFDGDGLYVELSSLIFFVGAAGRDDDGASDFFAFADLSVALVVDGFFGDDDDDDDDAFDALFDMFAATTDADDGVADDCWLGVIRRGPPRDPAPPPVLAVARPVVAERVSPPMPGALGPTKYGSAMVLLRNPKYRPLMT